MSATWSAKGLLQPLWGRVDGRDALARLTGIPAPNLSGYNTGRLRMGLSAGRRIADALDVTIYDLGAPVDAEEQPHPLLAEIQTTLDEFQIGIARQMKAQADLLAKLGALAVRMDERLDPPGEEPGPPGRTRRPA